MIYCDTSLLVSILTPEVHSVSARRWFDAQGNAALAVSDWSHAEFASALAMKQRRGILTAPGRQDVWAAWERMVASSFAVFDVQSIDFRRAGQLVDAGERGLRAADALHLAVAARHRCALATLDDDLLGAATAIGLDAPQIRTGLD